MLRKLFVALMLTFLCAAASAADRVNINKASADALATALTGVGSARAAAIVQYRKAHGPFPSVSALTRVKGIGEATLAKNKDHITVGQAD